MRAVAVGWDRIVLFAHACCVLFWLVVATPWQVPRLHTYKLARLHFLPDEARVSNEVKHMD